MTPARRLQLVISCCLAFLLVSGSVLPPPALWHCRHAARVVDAGFSAKPSAMPCRMGGVMPKAGMTCCLPLRAMAAGKSAAKALDPPPCTPVLTRLAALPPANPAESRVTLSLVAASAVLPLPAAVLPSVPLTLSLRQRPPPAVALSLSPVPHAPGLRAPPVA